MSIRAARSPGSAPLDCGTESSLSRVAPQAAAVPPPDRERRCPDCEPTTISACQGPGQLKQLRHPSSRTGWSSITGKLLIAANWTKWPQQSTSARWLLPIAPSPPTAHARLSRRADKHRSTPREDSRRFLLNEARAIQDDGSPDFSGASSRYDLLRICGLHSALRSGIFVPDPRDEPRLSARVAFP